MRTTWPRLRAETATRQPHRDVAIQGRAVRAASRPSNAGPLHIPRSPVYGGAHSFPRQSTIVKPIEICTVLGPERVDAYYNELSGKEIRAVLKAGGSHSNTPSTAFTQAARRKTWRKRFDAEFGSGNDQLALALLIEWLMRHHRNMLVDYLDFLKVKHQQGETEEDFCQTRTPEQLREGATYLLGKHTAHEVATYLLLIGHLQETPVYDETPSLLEALGMSNADATEYAAAHASRRAAREGATAEASANA